MNLFPRSILAFLRDLFVYPARPPQDDIAYWVRWFEHLAQATEAERQRMRRELIDSLAADWSREIESSLDDVMREWARDA